MNDQQANALFGEAIQLLQQGKASESLKILAKLDLAIPSNPGILYFTAVGHSIAGKKQKAIQIYERVVRLNPQFVEAYNNLSLDLMAIGKLEESRQVLHQALNVNPEFIDAHTNLGTVLIKTGQIPEAQEHFNKAISLDQNNISSICGLAKCFLEQGKHNDARALFDRALQINPNHNLTHAHLGVLYHEIGNVELAAKHFQTFSENDSNVENLRYHHALFLLHTLSLKLGSELYGLRWKEADLPIPHLQTFRKPWDGSKTADKVLIWHEQGVGDQILFGSLLHEAIKQAPNLLVRLDERLVPLFQRSFPSVHFIAPDSPLSDEDFEYHLPLGDLGRLFRSDLNDFQRQPANYLKADSQQTEKCREQIGMDAPVVGISWLTRGKRSRERNLPIEEVVSSIHQTFPCQFIDLQYSDTTDKRKQIADETGVLIRHLDQIDNLNDLDGLASLIDACDFVVTCSNTTAHLAGALGKQTYLLVPFSRGRHWYWSHLSEASTSLWYPSIRVIPQTIAGDWTQPMATLNALLSERKK